MLVQGQVVEFDVALDDRGRAAGASGSVGPRPRLYFEVILSRFWDHVRVAVRVVAAANKSRHLEVAKQITTRALLRPGDWIGHRHGARNAEFIQSSASLV